MNRTNVKVVKVTRQPGSKNKTNVINITETILKKSNSAQGDFSDCCENEVEDCGGVCSPSTRNKESISDKLSVLESPTVFLKQVNK